MAEDDTNWDDELKSMFENEQFDLDNPTGLSAEEARFDIVVSRIDSVMQKWAETPVWASVPTDPEEIGILELDNEPFEGGTETCLGDVASVPILGLLAKILRDMLSLENDTPQEEDLMRYRDEISHAVTGLMVEGILVFKSPPWNDDFEEAAAGLTQRDTYKKD